MRYFYAVLFVAILLVPALPAQIFKAPATVAYAQGTCECADCQVSDSNCDPGFYPSGCNKMVRCDGGGPPCNCCPICFECTGGGCQCKPRCGDGLCVGTETPNNCPSDCVPLGTCGNGVLNPGEECDNGAANGLCPAVCNANCHFNNCPLPPTTAITSPPAGSTQTANFVVQFSDSNGNTCQYRVLSNGVVTKSWTVRTCSGSATVTVGPTAECRNAGSNKCLVESQAINSVGVDTDSRSFTISFGTPQENLATSGTCWDDIDNDNDGKFDFTGVVSPPDTSNPNFPEGTPEGNDCAFPFNAISAPASAQVGSSYQASCTSTFGWQPRLGVNIISGGGTSTYIGFASGVGYRSTITTSPTCGIQTLQCGSNKNGVVIQSPAPSATVSIVSSGPETGKCSDSIDNDCDGAIDCSDSQCNSDPACAICGNGIVEGFEQCDLGAGNGACPSACSISCTNNNCQPPPSTAITSPPVGSTQTANFIVQFSDSNANSCQYRVISNGFQTRLWTARTCSGSATVTVGPTAECRNAGSNTCTVESRATNSVGSALADRSFTISFGPVPGCGNGVVEGTEQCDNGAANGACPATCSVSCTMNNCQPPPTTSITSPAAGSTQASNFIVQFSDSNTNNCQYRILSSGVQTRGWTARTCSSTASVSVGSSGECRDEGANTCRVESSVTNNAGTATASRTFGIDYSPPSISVSGPSGTIRSDAGVTITLTSSDTGSGISLTEIFVDGTRMKNCGSAQCNWSAPSLAAGLHTYHGTAKDVAGNSVNSTAQSFTVNRAPSASISYTGSNNPSSQITLNCDITDDGAVNTFDVRVWAGECNAANCFDTRAWATPSTSDIVYHNNSQMAFNSSGRFIKGLTIAQAAGTGLAATCRATDEMGENSNFADAYPLFVVNGCLNAPVFTNITSTPSRIETGAVTIRFTSSSALVSNPNVTVPSIGRSATFVSKSGNDYTYSFQIVSGDPSGLHNVRITGQNSQCSGTSFGGAFEVDQRTRFEATIILNKNVARRGEKIESRLFGAQMRGLTVLEKCTSATCTVTKFTVNNEDVRPALRFNTTSQEWTYEIDTSRFASTVEGCIRRLSSGSNDCAVETYTVSDKTIDTNVRFPDADKGFIPITSAGQPNFTRPMQLMFVAEAQIVGATTEKCNANNCQVRYRINGIGGWGSAPLAAFDSFESGFVASPVSNALDCDTTHTLEINVSENRLGVQDMSTISSRQIFLSCTSRVIIKPVEKRLAAGAKNQEAFEVTFLNPKDAMRYTLEMTSSNPDGYPLQWIHFRETGQDSVVLNMPAISSQVVHVDMPQAVRAGIFPVNFVATDSGGNIFTSTGSILVFSESLPEFAPWQLIPLITIALLLVYFDPIGFRKKR